MTNYLLVGCQKIEGGEEILVYVRGKNLDLFNGPDRFLRISEQSNFFSKYGQIRPIYWQEIGKEDCDFLVWDV